MSTLKVDTYLTRGGASEIAIDKLKGASSEASISVVAEGGSTTTNLQQGLCKAWSHFNGSGTVALQDSFNCASITDRAAGLFTVVFINDMGNNNHSSSGSVKKDNSTDDGNIMVHIGGDSGYTTAVGEIRIITRRVDQALSAVDGVEIQSQTFGDLA
jgi:hypothetical protein